MKNTDAAEMTGHAAQQDAEHHCYHRNERLERTADGTWTGRLKRNLNDMCARGTCITDVDTTELQGELPDTNHPPRFLMAERGSCENYQQGSTCSHLLKCAPAPPPCRHGLHCHTVCMQPQHVPHQSTAYHPHALATHLPRKKPQ